MYRRNQQFEHPVHLQSQDLQYVKKRGLVPDAEIKNNGTGRFFAGCIPFDLACFSQGNFLHRRIGCGGSAGLVNGSFDRTARS